MDSANILSILSSINGNQDPGGAPPMPPAAPAAPATNVMQAAAPAAPTPQQEYQDPTAVAQAATAASPAMPQPHQRRSLLDTIGRISDVLATVGGAAPLYQPTLDARQAHEQAQEDRQRTIAKDNVDLATSKFDLTDKQREAGNDERSRFASVLDAVNDPEDAANLPAMMAAAGLTDPRYQPFIKMVQADPDKAKVLSGALGGGDASSKLGHNLYFGTDSKGKTVAYQIGDDGQPHILDFSGAGVTPGEPIKMVNTGGSNVAVGSQTGTVKRILPNSVSPNTAANNQTSTNNNIRTNQTNLTIAGMPARSKDGGGNSKGAIEDPNIPMYLNNIRQGFTDLHNMQALPGEGGALGQVEGAIGRTGIGQKVGEQLGTPAAQKRLEVSKNISQLQQAMLKSLPASATRTKFEQEMLARGLPDPSKMDFKTANTVIDQLWSSYQNALKTSPKPAAAATPSVNGGNLPTLGPAEAAKLKPGTPFRTLDGRVMVRH